MNYHFGLGRFSNPSVLVRAGISSLGSVEEAWDEALIWTSNPRTLVTQQFVIGNYPQLRAVN